MLRRSEGFFLAELLLSLSAWLMATTILLPLTIQLIGQSIDTRREADALHLLYQRLQAMKAQEFVGTNVTEFELNGVVYRYNINNSQPGLMTEVCVEFNGYFHEVKSKCAFAE